MTRQLAALVIPGAPVPKGRPRHGQGRTYTPEQTRDFEAKVGWLGRQAMKGRKPSAARVSVVIDVYGPPVGDADNVAKSILDGLQTIVFVSDSQVDYLLIRRHITAPDPRAMVVVAEMPGATS